MITEHQTHFADARTMSDVATQSVHLVVTSPPYPMIEMWDDQFQQDAAVRAALKGLNGPRAFELMHRQLDRVWDEVNRVLVPGGIACINIGDATRTLGDEFALYPNHSRVISHLLSLGLTTLPHILWRKQTNAPNKFMGSGMMPPGAYVTLEHEYILIFRKGGKRLFASETQKNGRRQSAFFWEERNGWFSDVWMDLKGTRQKTADERLRKRSAAYPFELAYRLICMFSVMGDTVLDPFLGTGTTLFAAAAAGRNSLGYELDPAFRFLIDQGWQQSLAQSHHRISGRLEGHLQFIRDRQAAGKIIKYTNQVYGFPVMTRQETALMLPCPRTIEPGRANHIRVTYETPVESTSGRPAAIPDPPPLTQPSQLQLFA